MYINLEIKLFKIRKKRKDVMNFLAYSLKNDIFKFLLK